MQDAPMAFTPQTRDFYHRPRLTLDESLNRLARRLWPDRPGAGMRREWGLTASQSREVLRDRAGKTVLWQVLRTGGWDVALEIFEPVIGVPFEAYADQRRSAALDAFESMAALDFGPTMRGRR
jgi:hypothetical protein